MLRFLYMTVDHLHHIVCLGDILRYVVADHFTFIVLVKDFFFHHALTNGRHLRAVFRVDDRGYDVTTERRTDLI